MEATTPSEFDADPGSYVIRVSLDGYKTAEKQVTVTSGEIATANFYLELAGEGQAGIDEPGVLRCQCGSVPLLAPVSLRAEGLRRP